jgi:hypothetical protein
MISRLIIPKSGPTFEIEGRRPNGIPLEMAAPWGFSIGTEKLYDGQAAGSLTSTPRSFIICALIPWIR